MTARVLQFTIMPKVIERSYPNRIREWRKAAGLTLAKLGKAVGVPGSMVQRWEIGERDLPLARLEQIARALGCSTADLLNLEHGGLRPGEREMLDTYRQLPEVNQKVVDSVMESQQAFRIQPDVVQLPRKTG